MEKDQLIPAPSDPYVLTATGQHYDGIDEEFDEIIRNIGHFNYFLPLQPRHIAASYHNVILHPGEALYHVSALAAGCLSIFNLPNRVDGNFEKAKMLIPYIIKWMDYQID